MRGDRGSWAALVAAGTRAWRACHLPFPAIRVSRQVTVGQGVVPSETSKDEEGKCRLDIRAKATKTTVHLRDATSTARQGTERGEDK